MMIPKPRIAAGLPLGQIVLSEVKRLIRTAVGCVLLLVGMVMLVLPGPALLVIPLGLAILAIDFPWARALIERGRACLCGRKRSASAGDTARGRHDPTNAA